MKSVNYLAGNGPEMPNYLSHYNFLEKEVLQVRYELEGLLQNGACNKIFLLDGGLQCLNGPVFYQTARVLLLHSEFLRCKMAEYRTLNYKFILLRHYLKSRGIMFALDAFNQDEC